MANSHSEPLPGGADILALNWDIHIELCRKCDSRHESCQDISLVRLGRGGDSKSYAMLTLGFAASQHHRRSLRGTR